MLVCEVSLRGASVVTAAVVWEVSSGGPRVPGLLECLVVGVLGAGVAGLFGCLVTHFLVLLGIFPGAWVVLSGAVELSPAGGLVAGSPGSQASGSLPRSGSQLQLKGSAMESRPGVPVHMTPTSSL